MINIEKSQPAPVCLETEKQKANGNYRCGEVIPRLQADFHNKCYLCEEKASSSINVEHFIPHKENQDLKFDWNNLFYACSHCNNTKGSAENILDCTNKSHQIPDWIRFHIKPYPKEKAIISARIENETVFNTVELLNRIYNGTTTLKVIESANLRQKLLKEIDDFSSLLKEYYWGEGFTEDEKRILHRKIVRKLSPESPFTAFKIWICKENKIYARNFLQKDL